MANLNTTMDGHYDAISTESEWRVQQTARDRTGRQRSRRKWDDERRAWTVDLVFETRETADAFLAVFNAGSGPATLTHTWTPPRESHLSSPETYNVKFEGEKLREDWSVNDSVFRYSVQLVEVPA